MELNLIVTGKEYVGWDDCLDEPSWICFLVLFTLIKQETAHACVEGSKDFWISIVPAEITCDSEQCADELGSCSPINGWLRTYIISVIQVRDVCVCSGWMKPSVFAVWSVLISDWSLVILISIAWWCISNFFRKRLSFSVLNFNTVSCRPWYNNLRLIT